MRYSAQKNSGSDHKFDETEDSSTLTMVKVLALGNQELVTGQLKPLKEVISRIKAKGAPPDNFG